MLNTSYKRIKIFFLVPLVLVLMFSGCDDETRPADWENANNVAIQSTTNAFNFALNAKQYSIEKEYILDFTKKGLAIAIAINNYGGGNGTLKLINQKDSVFYSVDLNKDLNLSNTTLNWQIPAKMAISLTDYFGNLAISIAGI